ncbi:MAG: hypothetical protein ER33_10630 [Cyanobium sp. CACIAM 14]|nr:MAG: hypothetical protein ER33_10630 [Cyanobium sp. CACIAM 14]
MRRFPVAPWPLSLQIVSGLGSLMLCGVAYAAWRAIPVPTGFTHTFGLGVAAVPLVVLVGALLFIVSGYRVDANALLIDRLLTTTHLPLAGLERVWAEPSVCRGSLRIFGNGGLFCFCGWFYNPRLGRYRLFATDWRKAVVLQFTDHVAVVSPASPQAFVDHLHRILPGVALGPEEGGTVAWFRRRSAPEGQGL